MNEISGRDLISKKRSSDLDYLLSKVFRNAEEMNTNGKIIDENNEDKGRIRELDKENEKLKKIIVNLEEKLKNVDVPQRESERKNTIANNVLPKSRGIFSYAWLYLMPMTLLFFMVALYYIIRYPYSTDSIFVILTFLTTVASLTSISYLTYNKLERKKLREREFEDYFDPEQVKSKTFEYIEKGKKYILGQIILYPTSLELESNFYYHLLETIKKQSTKNMTIILSFLPIPSQHSNKYSNKNKNLLLDFIDNFSKYCKIYLLDYNDIEYHFYGKLQNENFFIIDDELIVVNELSKIGSIIRTKIYRFDNDIIESYKNAFFKYINVTNTNFQ